MTSFASSFTPKVVTIELPFWGMAALDLRTTLSSLTGSTAVLVERAPPATDALSATIPLIVGDAVHALELRVVATPRALQLVCAHLGGHVAADVEALEKVLMKLATQVATVIESAATDQGFRYTVGAPTVTPVGESTERRAEDIPVTMTYVFDPRGEAVLVEARQTP
jgi:hypothetical protein